jgi:Tfp pilus assembly protein PilF
VTFAAPKADTGQASIQERLKRVGANLFSGADRVNESIRELKAILAVDPRSAEAHFLLGIAYGKVGSTKLMGEAVAEFRQALSLNPSLVQARY